MAFGLTAHVHLAIHGRAGIAGGVTDALFGHEIAHIWECAIVPGVSGREREQEGAVEHQASRGRGAGFELSALPPVATGARAIKRKAEFGFVPNSESLVTHRLYHARYIARSMACAHVGACKWHFRGGSGFRSRLQTRRRPGPAGYTKWVHREFSV